MSAPKGNQFWKLAPKQGRNAIWEKPEDLRSACEEYFEYVISTPLEEDGTFAFQGIVTHEPIQKMRTMSIEGLCVFLGIVRQTWNNYKAKDEFLVVTEYVTNVMYDYKITGAASGLLNPSIIVRDLKLRDAVDSDITSNGKPITLTDTEREAKISGLLARVEKRLDESGD